MSDDDAPKSAVELAMEKLRTRGGFEEVTLTDEQKVAIADIRSRYRAQIAELEIKNDSALRAVGSYEEAEALRAELKKEKERLEEEMEKKVSEVRARTS
jgi:Spy/CpxP family protein refolding chaperone